MMPSELYHVQFSAPEGQVLAVFTLMQGRVYGPEDATFLPDTTLPDGAPGLRVQCKFIPCEAEARAVAARAATRWAEIRHDPFRDLLKLLIPF